MSEKKRLSDETEQSRKTFILGSRRAVEKQRAKEAAEMTPEAVAERARRRKEQEDEREAAAKAKLADKPLDVQEPQYGDWNYIKDKKSKLKSMQGPKR